MNKIELCLQNKIADSSKLRPTILKAILNLYNRGIGKMTAEMVKNECLDLDISKPWNERIPAICLSMKNATECGGRIIGEYREINGFTISFDDNGNNLEISTPKKTSPKAETNKKEKPIFSSNTPNKKTKIELEKLNLSKNFKVVMVCAGGKKDSFFTAYPDENFVNNAVQKFEHHPDEIMNNGITSWRDYLMNNQNDNNLLEAYNLYKRNEYRCLFKKYKNDFYILSSGWGLVNSEFKLPKYDITFSKTANNITKRIYNNASQYNDFNQLVINSFEDIIYVGGNDYLELFYQLTQNLPNRKIIYHFGTALPLNIVLPNQTFLYRQYLPENPNDRRNWHYELAYKISNGIIP